MSVLFTELLGSMIGHVLLLERILATVFVSKYEHYKQPYFSIICFLIMVGNQKMLTPKTSKHYSFSDFRS